ncbi:GAF domain-containing sensor histidine kinase [soil metagenome]
MPTPALEPVSIITSAHDLSADVEAVASLPIITQLLDVIGRTTGLGLCAVARVTTTRWIACAVHDRINFGLKAGGELEIRTTICNEIRDSGQMVVIDDVSKDPQYCGHPIPRQYNFQSYISVPIRLPNGDFFGTLCAIDPRPLPLSAPETVGMFQLFADLLGQHLDAHRRAKQSEAALLTERESAQLREQFIAVLGHDLRNPLAAIKVAGYLLRTPRQGQDLSEVAEIIQESANRMAELITNLMDFARGRLGGGLALNMQADPGLAEALEQVVSELKFASPTRAIHRDIEIARLVTCDVGRIKQVLSNLLGNALRHGDPQKPITVRARTDNGVFEFSVTNGGAAIPEAIRKVIFQPFSRGVARRGQEGLGLGLYIASEIAKAHGATLEFFSDNRETKFVFRMPITDD